MGVLKDLTEEYFGEKVRKEDDINIDGLDVEIVSFKDNNGNVHRRGYKPKDLGDLKKLLERMIEVRGDESDFNDIDTSEIESMKNLFNGNKTFNGNISSWDVSKVENMESMFYMAISFNQPIGNWKFPNVTDMSFMFRSATSFNQPIEKWKFPKVRYMSFMFCGATSFNQPIGGWKFPKFTNMDGMFYDATSFNQDLSSWDLTDIDKNNIFKGCPIKDEFKPKMK